MFEKAFSVPYYGIDLKRRMKFGLLLEYFQEAADLHSRMMKMSVDDLQRRGMTWVLRRYRINMFHYPGREELTVRTWHEPYKNLHSLRVFEVFDGTERKIARGWSSWILLDRRKGRPLRLDRAAPREYYDMAEPTGEGAYCGIEPMGPAYDFEKNYQVRWLELDVNGHVNHTVYCNWALEAVPDELLRTHLPTELDAEFLCSVTREDVVARTRQTGDDPVRFAHTVFVKESGEEAARLTSAWSPSG